MIKVEKTTRHGYVGKIDKHIRPTIGALSVGRLDAEVIESLYAQLRTCSEHCGGRTFVSANGPSVTGARSVGADPHAVGRERL